MSRSRRRIRTSAGGTDRNLICNCARDLRRRAWEMPIGDRIWKWERHQCAENRQLRRRNRTPNRKIPTRLRTNPKPKSRQRRKSRRKKGQRETNQRIPPGKEKKNHPASPTRPLVKSITGPETEPPRQTIDAIIESAATEAEIAVEQTEQKSDGETMAREKRSRSSSPRAK